LAFLSAYFLANYRAKQLDDWNKHQVEDMIFYGAMGVVAGGRLGYMLFYNFDIFLNFKWN
jgi:phosphatidylglycerol:prolipoprotein diacylglycerol transferase